jgi:hypothetical protein
MADSRLEKLRLVAEALRGEGLDVAIQPKRGAIYVYPTAPKGVSFSFHQTVASGMWRGVRYGTGSEGWQEIRVKVPAASADIARIAQAIVEAMRDAS